MRNYHKKHQHLDIGKLAIDYEFLSIGMKQLRKIVCPYCDQELYFDHMYTERWVGDGYIYKCHHCDYSADTGKFPQIIYEDMCLTDEQIEKIMEIIYGATD
jgi:hypothetical protein